MKSPSPLAINLSRNTNNFELLSTLGMSDRSEEERERKSGKPRPTLSHVAKICSETWDILTDASSISQLESYDDANFYVPYSHAVTSCDVVIDSADKRECLIKFYNSVESKNFNMLRGISLLLHTVSSYSVKSSSCSFLHPAVPVPCKIACVNRTNAKIDEKGLDTNNRVHLPDDFFDDVAFSSVCVDDEGAVYRSIAARVFNWIPGITLNKAGRPTETTPKLITNLGFALGSITNSLKSFDHPAFRRRHSWDLQNFESVSAVFSVYIVEPDISHLVNEVLSRFKNLVVPDSNIFRRSVIMGDCNDANVIVSTDKSAVVGIIDFGDAVYTWSINEVAIAIAYALLTDFGQADPMRCISCIYGGYVYAVDECRRHSTHSNVPEGGSSKPSVDVAKERETDRVELEHLHTLLCVRLCLSIMIGAYSISMDPSNEYLKLHSHPAKEALRRLLLTELQESATGQNTRQHDLCLTSQLDHQPLGPSNLKKLFQNVRDAIFLRKDPFSDASLVLSLIRIASECSDDTT